MKSTIDGLHISESEIAKTCRVKVYPDGSCEVMASEKPIFRASGWEEEKPILSNKTDRSSPSAEALERSRRRAIARIRDYALCSDFEWFVTLTLSPDLIDRHDYDAAVKKLGIYCSNRVQRHGLRYVIVTEKHKDGALHFHGFLPGCRCRSSRPPGPIPAVSPGRSPSAPGLPPSSRHGPRAGPMRYTTSPAGGWASLRRYCSSAITAGLSPT